jgi:hypothetical protein
VIKGDGKASAATTPVRVSMTGNESIDSPLDQQDFPVAQRDSAWNGTPDSRVVLLLFPYTQGPSTCAKPPIKGGKRKTKHTNKPARLTDEEEYALLAAAIAQVAQHTILKTPRIHTGLPHHTDTSHIYKAMLPLPLDLS